MMENIFQHIQTCSPITLNQLRQQLPEARFESLKNIQCITFKGFTINCSWYLIRLTNCIHYELNGLSTEALHLFLTVLSITIKSWKSNNIKYAQIESLQITNSTYTDQIIEDLIDCIQIIPSIRSLTLIPNRHIKTARLTNSQFLQLCTLFEKGCCPMLDTLQLPYNSITTTGLTQLVSCYKSYRLLKCHAIDLSYNALSYHSTTLLTSFFKCEQTLFIQRIVLNGCYIKGKEGERLLKALASEKRVVLYELELADTHMSNSLVQLLFVSIQNHIFPSLTHLNLSSIHINYTSMIEFATAIRYNALQHMQSLVLNHCAIHNTVLSILCNAIKDTSLPYCTVLSLDNNVMNEHDCMLLSEILCRDYLPSLHSLSLNNNKIQDKGLQYMIDYSQCENMNSLSFNQCNITDKGIEILCNTIASRSWCTHLKTLHLKNNPLSGMSILYLQNLFEIPINLETIQLSDSTKEQKHVTRLMNPIKDDAILISSTTITS